MSIHSFVGKLLLPLILLGGHNKQQGNYFCHWKIIDPLDRPTIPAGSDDYLCTCCPSVCPSAHHFSNLVKQNNRK